MLYTTYIANMKKIPEDTVTAIIMRMPPYSIRDLKYGVHIPQLSPKIEVLNAYKSTGDFATFEEEFNKQMYEDEETKEYLNLLMEALNENDIAIVCCEKDASICHRSLIAKYLNELGYESKEI